MSFKLTNPFNNQEMELTQGDINLIYNTLNEVFPRYKPDVREQISRITTGLDHVGPITYKRRQVRDYSK